MKCQAPSPTTQSARGRGGGAQLERPLQGKNKHLPSPARPLSKPTYHRPGCGAGALQPGLKRTENEVPSTKPHHPKRAWSWGWGAARAAATSQKQASALSRLPRALSQSLRTIGLGVALGPYYTARTKKYRKAKNHAASPTSYSARPWSWGRGAARAAAVRQLFLPSATLSRTLCWAG
jgi:hypothetical protein